MPIQTKQSALLASASCCARRLFSSVKKKPKQCLTPCQNSKARKEVDYGGTLLGGKSDTGWNDSSVISELVHLVIDIIKKRSDSAVFPLNEDLSVPQGRGARWLKVRLGTFM